MSQGRHAEAEECYRKALTMQPDYAAGHGNLLFALNYRPDATAEAIFAEYQDWDRRHAKHLGSDTPPFTLDRTPGRRLRIGYVSADFRQHAVAMFAEPLLAAHDRSNVELYLYAGVPAEDAATERFRSLSDHWRSTIGLCDAKLAELIRADQIDVLVDLAGHTAGNRLLTFARRPAPVQVAYLLGHGYSTGLSAMDAFLADDALAPEGADALFSERLVRLPRIPLAYAPPEDMPPVAPLPALSNGYVTFGHFGRTERLNDNVIATWAHILHTVPRSRLILDNRPFQEAAFRDLFLARFASHGIDPARLDLVYSTPQSSAWAAYGSIDIALDPFPHNAGTTTIEALWQGVPVVTLAWQADGRPVRRQHPACGRARRLDHRRYRRLCGARRGSRNRPRRARAIACGNCGSASPRRRCATRAGLARDIEQTYRTLWNEWREGDVARLHRLYTEGNRTAAADLAQRMLRRDEADAAAHHVLGSAGLSRPSAWRGRYSPAAAPSHTFPRRPNCMPTTRRSCASWAGSPMPKPPRVARWNWSRIASPRTTTWATSCATPAGGTKVPTVIARRSAWRRTSPMPGSIWPGSWHWRDMRGRRRKPPATPSPATRTNADAHNNLGLALMRQGRLAEAEAALRQALALRPDFALPHSNILFCLNYRPEASAEEIFAEYRCWDRQHALPLLPAHPSFELDRSPERRLRVGYVSPDFRQHAVALFAEPLLAAHDRSAVELHCYAEVPAPDAVTERFRALADHWHSTVGLSDAELAEQIRRDRIDVLVDLAGHTAGNRLLTFARKPAPIQVTWLLGHGYSSGLSAMDAFLADAELAPQGSDGLFSERLVRLSRIPLAYAPPAEMPDVAPLPALPTAASPSAISAARCG